MRKPALPLIALSLAAWVMTSCGQQSPTSPSSVSPLDDLTEIPVIEYVVTLADPSEEGDPEPAPEPGPAPEPAPVPAPAPAPAPPPAPAPTPPSSGWSPGAPPPPATPTTPVPTPPSKHTRVSLKVDPEPVPHSGKAITDVNYCRPLKYTWFYDQYIHAETGVKVTFTERENFFDGRFASKSTETLTLNGNATIVLKTRWCSGYGVFHYTQTRFKGTDEYGEKVEISGPWVRLLAP